jgi:sodium/proline symporter
MRTMILVFIYFAVILLVGFFAGRRTKDMSSYMVGGRNLGVWVVSLGIMAAVMSGWTWLGNPGSAYTEGYSAVITYTAFSPLGLVLSYFLIAKPVRIISEKFNCYTLADILAVRWNDNKTIRFLSGIIILIGSATYLVSQWVSMGTAVQAALGTGYKESVIIGAVIITLYIIAGGMLASMWTNFIQMIIMFFVAGILLVAGFAAVGGFANMNEQIAGIDSQMISPWHTGDSGFSMCFVLSYTIFMLVMAYGGQPAVNTKFMMIKDKKLLKWSPFISVIALIIGTFMVYIGIQGRILVENGSIPAPERQDTILLDVISHIIPAGLADLFLIAILAAVMSTAETHLFNSSTSIIQDLVIKSLHINIEEHKVLMLTRITMAGIAVITVILSISPPPLISLIGTQAFGTFCAGFAPVLYLGLRWKRMSTKAAVAGMSVGLAAGGIFPIMNNLLFDGALLSNWTIGGLAVVTSYAVTIMVTILTKAEKSKVFE